VNSPFEGRRNAKVFDAMLVLRWNNWTRIRRNMLARRRYHAKKLLTRQRQSDLIEL
jgi:hypothetical protein